MENSPISDVFFTCNPLHGAGIVIAHLNNSQGITSIRRKLGQIVLAHGLVLTNKFFGYFRFAKNNLIYLLL